jgi:parallel beta-helix repeat protein
MDLPNPTKAQTWDQSDPANGPDFDTEFDRLYENDIALKDSLETGGVGDADTLDGADKSTDGTMAGNSDDLIPTEKAIVTYTANNRGVRKIAGSVGSQTVAANETLVVLSGSTITGDITVNGDNARIILYKDVEVTGRVDLSGHENCSLEGAGESSKIGSVVCDNRLDTFTETGDIDGATAVITNVSDTSSMKEGQPVSGTGIAADSRILSVDSASQITLDKNTTAAGSGVTLTVIKVRGGIKICNVKTTTYYDRALVYIDYADAIIDGVNSSGFSSYKGLEFRRYGYKKRGCRVVNCICNGNGHGITFEKSGEVVVSKNICNENGGMGIKTHGTDTSLVFGNTCLDNGGYGINIGKALCANNTCNGNDYGIRADSSTGSITGNVCNNNTSYGIYNYLGSPVITGNLATGNGTNFSDAGSAKGGCNSWNADTP